jgi:hypothetical protein
MPMMLGPGSKEIDAVLFADVRITQSNLVVWWDGLIVDADDIQTGIRVIESQSLTRLDP